MVNRSNSHWSQVEFPRQLFPRSSRPLNPRQRCPIGQSIHRTTGSIGSVGPGIGRWPVGHDLSQAPQHQLHISILSRIYRTAREKGGGGIRRIAGGIARPGEAQKWYTFFVKRPYFEARLAHSVKRGAQRQRLPGRHAQRHHSVRTKTER